MSVACLRKKRYPSEAAAQSAIYTMRARGTQAQVHAEKCGICGGWHLKAGLLLIREHRA